MVNTVIIIVPTLWKGRDEKNLVVDPWEQKATLDHYLHEEHYHVKLMIAYEYRKILYTQYVLEKEDIDGQ